MAWDDNLEKGTPAFNLASTKANVVRAVAGPGSGKSFAIKRRIARLLEEGVQPEQILAVTFTRTSANDLKQEISSLGIAGAEDVHSSTLHSHALKILMTANVLEQNGRIPRMVLDHEILPALRDLQNGAFGDIRYKKTLLDEYTAAWARLQSDEPGFVKNETQEQFEREIVAWLVAHHGILVGEVIPLAIEYLRNNPASPEIGKYQTILVDEYQDLNRSEQEFIRLIRGTASVVIVGDDDQSIYSFKFAHPEGIKEINELYGDYEDIAFAECRRCPQTVTNMASELISNNTNRTLGELVAHPGNAHGEINIIQWPTYQQEIDGLSSIIELELKKGTILPQDILILAPRRKIGYRMRDTLLAAGLPVKSYFREDAIDSDPVRRAYSLLSYLSDPDDLISQRFLLGFGSGDYRANQYAILESHASEKGISIQELLKQLLKEEVTLKGVSTILAEYRKVVTDSATLRAAIIKNPSSAIQDYFVRTAEDEERFYEFVAAFQQAVDDAGADGLADNDDFANWFSSVFNSFQESIAFPDSPKKIDHIRIMSLHASKGLSAKFVILCSMVDPLMPFIPKKDEKSAEEIARIVQEQRRLFYVAITRCKATDAYSGRLIISSFLSISRVLSLQMSIPGVVNGNAVNVSSTRFLKDFMKTSPVPVKGETLMQK